MTDRKQLERYLLGAMTEDEREALERAYFNDPSLFEEVVRAENELADEYARGLLAADARERFERYYMAHPARRERALFAEALAAKIDGSNKVADDATERIQSSWTSRLNAWRGPKFIWAMTAALLLVVSITALFVFREKRRQHDSSIAEAGRPTQELPAGESQQPPASVETPSGGQPAVAKNGQAEQPTAPPAPTPTPTKATPAFVTLTLALAGTRGPGEGPSTLVIPARTERVRLRLNMGESDYARYAVVLSAAGGGEIFERRGLTPRNTKSGASLALDVPAGLFTAGDYVLTLKGVGETGEAEDVSKSLIRVERR